jgi:hypothetical protein
MPVPRRDDELLSEVLRRLDRFEEELKALQKLVVERLANVEAMADQNKQIAAQWFAQAWPAHGTDHRALEKRIADLETTRARAEGAAWVGRLLWGTLAALAGAGVTALMRGHS